MFRLFIEFFKIGAFTFGGGYAMIPLIEAAVVERQQWLSKDEFMEMLAVVQSLPGPISINTALFVGYRKYGITGALLATLGIAIPSFVIILLIALVFTDYAGNPVVERVFKGLRPAVVALIAAPIVRMYKIAGVTWKNIWIPIVATILIGFLGVSPVWVIIGVIVYSLLVKLLGDRITESPHNRITKKNDLP